MSGVQITVYGAQAIAEAAAASVAACEQIAQQIAAEAQAAAPVLTGAYRNGIHAEGTTVLDEDPDAIHKEYGTLDTPAHAILTDAARKYGKYTGMKPGRR